MANATQFETYPGESSNSPAVKRANGHQPVLVSANGHALPDASASPPESTRASTPAGTPAPAEETYVFPASREQTRYWMLAQLDPESTASNMAIAFEIAGRIDDSAVEKSIAALTMRHEALRTVFRLEAGVLSQVVLSRPLYRFTVEDLSAVALAEQPAALEATVSRHGHTVIDLEAGPVLHAHLIHLDRERHVMALTMNHIVCDGWSNGILIRDFTLLYEALLAGKEAVLAELPFQFADFSLWQNEYLTSSAAEEAAAFWKSHITSDLSALDMPTDHPRPSGRSFPGHIESALLPKAIDDQLKAYCRQTGSTKHIVLLAAFEALCATYTGQKEFLLGSTIANRTQPGMEDVVGRFANPQIIVAKVNGDPNFAELEQRVREWETAAYTHQDLPFSRIIEDFQIDQAGATSQFLQVWFLYQKAFMQPQAGQTIRVTPRRSVSGGVDFDLLVSVVERAEGPRIQFEYNTVIFEPARIRGLIESFIQLLGSALQHPSLPLSQLARTASPAMTMGRTLRAAETAPAAKDPATADSSSIAGSFLLCFARHLAGRPDMLAITGAAAAISWRKLDERSSAVVEALKRANPNVTTVLVHLSRRVESMVALLAALQIGARIAPLPAHTDAAAAAICMARFTDAVLLGPKETGATLAFEDFAALPGAAEAADKRGEPSGCRFLFLKDAATSSFIEVDAATVFQSVAAALPMLGVDEESSLLSFPASTPLDACLDLLLALVSGAQLNFATDAGTLSLPSQSMASQIAAHEVNFILATPTQTKAIVSSGWPGDRRVALVVRGERLPASLAPMLTLRLKSAVYVLTAPLAGGFAAVQFLSGDRAAQGLLPAGNGSLMLTNPEGGVLPLGAFGEVCVQDGLSHGIRTGTMARSSSTGVIELSDRADRFVQLRGHRVCLGDIEDAAFALPSIRAISVAVTAADAESRMVAYLVAAPEQQDAGALRRHFHQTLPSHLVPSDYIWLDTLPFSADGRLDQQRLPRYEQNTATTSSAADALPTNEVEGKLAAIWKDVLALKSIDIHKSFFELGGSSLLLVRLFARINKAFDTSLPITTIFDAQTIAALAVTLGGGAEMTHLVQVQTAGTKPPLFMIHSYLLYQGLSISLGTDQPFYGLRELDKDGHLNIEERVQRYVAEIRQVQPAGPYHLAGWCAAGPLTVEVARHLLQSGEEVSYLALFDSWLPGYLESVEAEQAKASWMPYRTVSSKLTYHRHKLRGLGFWKKGMYGWLVVSRIFKETRYRIYLRNWERLHRLSEKYRFALPQFMHNTSFETFSALKDYRGQRVPVRLTLIRASDSREVPGTAASCGWEQIAEKGVDVLWAPGDHETMFIGEHLKVTSEIVKRGLEAAAPGNPQNSASTGHGANQIRGVLHVDCPST